MSIGEPHFGGRVGRTVAESEPWWPAPPTPPGAAPNVVIVVFDDTGFAHFGCYGSTIETPTIDRLAAGGLRYTGIHTTALCALVLGGLALSLVSDEGLPLSLPVLLPQPLPLTPAP